MMGIPGHTGRTELLPKLDARLTVDEAWADAEEQTKPFLCEIDGKRYKSKQGLAGHMKKAHSITSKSRKPRRAQKSKRTPKQAAFDPAVLLAQVAPGGTVPVNEVERVSKWLEEGRELRMQFSGKK